MRNLGKENDNGFPVIMHLIRKKKCNRKMQLEEVLRSGRVRGEKTPELWDYGQRVMTLNQP